MRTRSAPPMTWKATSGLSLTRCSATRRSSPARTASSGCGRSPCRCWTTRQQSSLRSEEHTSELQSTFPLHVALPIFILDAMLGDQALFTRSDGIERLWEISMPLLDNPPAVEPYQPGSWGPDSVRRITAPHRWHLPEAP